MTGFKGQPRNIERRRVQNRVAQQRFREKRKAKQTTISEGQTKVISDDEIQKDLLEDLHSLTEHDSRHEQPTNLLLRNYLEEPFPFPCNISSLPENQAVSIPLENNAPVVTEMCDKTFNYINLASDNGVIGQQNQSYMEERSEDFTELYTCENASECKDVHEHVRVQRTQLCRQAEQLLEKVSLIYDIGTSIGVFIPNPQLKDDLQKTREGFQSQRNSRAYSEENQEGCALKEC